MNGPVGGAYFLNGATGTTFFNVADVTGDSNPDLTISTPVVNLFSGAAGGLVKGGAGTLLLTATNTYTGTTLISAGTLAMSSTASLLNTGNVIIVTGGNASLAGSLSQVAGAIFTVGAGSSTFPSTTGSAAINGGTTTLTGYVAIGGSYDATPSDGGTGTLTISGGVVNVGPAVGGLPFNDDGSHIWLNPYGGSGSVLNLNGGTLSTQRPIADGDAGAATVNFNGGTLTAAAAGSLVDAGGPLALNVLAGGAIINSGTFTVTIAPSLVHGSGVTTDGGLTKLGSGTLALLASNTYNGVTTMSAGTLQLGNGGTTGSLGTAAVVDSGTLAYDLSSSPTVSNPISGSGGFAQIGTGTTTLSGTNSYSGGTLVSAGTLTATGSSALGAATGTLTVNNPNTGAGTAVVLNLSTTAATTTGSLSGAIGTPSSGTNTATINNGGQLFTVNQTTAGTFAGKIAGTGGFTLGALSTNTLTLTGSNSYSGTTTVAGGTLAVNGGSTGGLFGGGFLNVGASATQANFVMTSGAVTLGNPNPATQNYGVPALDIGSNGNSSNSSQSGGTLTVNGPMYVGDAYTGASETATFTQSGGTLNVADTTGNGLYIHQDGGSDSAVFNLNGGTLLSPYIYGGVGGSGTSTFRFSGGTVVATTSDDSGVGGGYPFMTLLTNAYVGTGGAIVNSNGYTIYITQTLAHDPMVGGTDGGFMKIGAGSLTLELASTYTGPSAVSAGTLRANNSSGSATGTGNISIGAGSSNYGGARLGGSGSVSGSVTLAASATAKQGGIIAAGADDSTIGTLTTGAQTWNGGAAYQWKIANAGTSGATPSGTPGTDYDQVVMSGLTVSTSSTAFTIAPMGSVTGVTVGNTYNWAIAQVGSGTSSTISVGGSTVTQSNTTPLSSSVFALDTSGLTVDSGSITPMPTDFSVYFETVGGNNDLVLTYNATPEPGTTMLVLAGALPMLTARRRRSRNK